MKPNLFVVGSAKCGTTSFCNLLSQHPDVYFCSKKEPHFFSNDNQYRKGIEYYENLFAETTNVKWVGEGSTSYSEAWLNRAEKSASRIHGYCPDAKIIYCVRDPIERIESKWLDALLARDNGWNNTELARSGSLNLTGNFNQDIKKHPEFVNTSNYWQQMSIYRKYFPSQNIKIVFFEDFKISPKNVLVETCDFLGICPEFSFESNHRFRNQTSSKGLSTSFGRFLRTLPGYKHLARNSPDGLRMVISVLTKQKFNHRPTWETTTRNEVIEALEADLSCFLSFCGKPANFWNSIN